MIREQVAKLVALGPIPSAAAASVEQVGEYQRLLEQISPPVEDDEAKTLLGVFGPDDGFGLAWALLHLIETAPNPPVTTQPPAAANEWIHRLWRRQQNATR